jgi:hypothetical protein
MSPSAESVIEAIRVAFGEVPPPDSYVHHSCSECADLEAALRGRAWGEVSFEMLREQRDRLPLLTGAALRYYLPAFMIAAIRRHRDADTMTASILSNVRRGAASFTDQELAAMRAFVAFVETHFGNDYPDALPRDALARLE